jgi:Flp pilus assembly secretin CpaC
MRSHILSLAVSFVAFFGLSTANAGEVWLTVDQVRAYKLPEPISAIVVGNPGIADVEVSTNTSIMLFGKRPGLTNIYFFNLKGERLDNVSIRVRTASDNMLTLQRGVEFVTYSCTTNCDVAENVSIGRNAFDVAKRESKKKAAEISGGGGGGDGGGGGGGS